MRRGINAAVVAALLLAAGCGHAPLPTADVSGTVTLDGRPCAGVTVAFLPLDDQPPGTAVATGDTDAGGRYTLADGDGKAGVAVGKYKAVVVRTRVVEDRLAKPARDAGPWMPPVYQTAGSSPFEVEVKAGVPQTVDLPLRR